MKVNVVTGLFDIKRGEFSNWSRPWQDYLIWFANGLSLNCNMTIFVEEKDVEFVKKNRMLIDPELKRTHIIVKDINSFNFIKYKDKMQSVMCNEDFRKGLVDATVPEVNYPLYNIITYSKSSMLKEASEFDFFKSDYFLWIDGGCMHHLFPPQYRNKVFPKSEKLIQDKIYLTCRSKPTTMDSNKHTFLKSHINRFAAFVIGVDKNNAKNLDNFFDSFLNEILNMNLIDCEQSALVYMYLQNPHVFHLYMGDWYDGFKNLIE